MERVLKNKKGKVIIFIIIFILTLIIPMPVDLPSLFWESGGTDLVPLAFIYLFGIFILILGISELGIKVVFFVLFPIVHILIVYLVTCFLYSKHERFKEDKVVN